MGKSRQSAGLLLVEIGSALNCRGGCWCVCDFGLQEWKKEAAAEGLQESFFCCPDAMEGVLLLLRARSLCEFVALGRGEVRQGDVVDLRDRANVLDVGTDLVLLRDGEKCPSLRV